MKFNTSDLDTQIEYQSLMRRIKSLTVKVGGKSYTGDFELSADGENNVTLEFAAKKRAKVGFPSTKNLSEALS